MVIINQYILFFSQKFINYCLNLTHENVTIARRQSKSVDLGSTFISLAPFSL